VSQVSISPALDAEQNMSQRKPIVAGNWKMNGSVSLVDEISSTLLNNLKDTVSLIVFPPSLLLTKAIEKGLVCGTQTVSENDSGAFTGETSAELSKQLGAEFTLVGHSERRSLYSESNQVVANKFSKAQENALTPILCVGETESERDAGQTEAVVAEQIKAVIEHSGIASLANSVIAYEPVWAIGTGKTASPEQAQSVHKFIRDMIADYDIHIANELRIIYGGSVNDSNSDLLFAQPDIDGGLIGGASLKADAFLSIYKSALGNV
jgi:triosephosphate isomerase